MRVKGEMSLFLVHLKSGEKFNIELSREQVGELSEALPAGVDLTLTDLRGVLVRTSEIAAIVPLEQMEAKG